MAQMPSTSSTEEESTRKEDNMDNTLRFFLSFSDNKLFVTQRSFGRISQKVTLLKKNWNFFGFLRRTFGNVNLEETSI